MKKVLFLYLALIASLTINAQIETKPEPTGKNSDELQKLLIPLQKITM